MVFLRFSFALVIPYLIVATALAQVRVATDFNADSRSDFVSVRITENDTLRWRTVLDGVRSGLGIFGKVGDHLILAPWMDTQVPQRGFLRREADNSVSWNIDGASSPIIFGTAKDLFVSGADLDASGFTDAVVVTKRKGGKLGWAVRTDPFAPGASSVLVSFNFGSGFNKAFFFNPSGSADEAAVIEKRNYKGKKQTVLRVRNMSTGRIRTIGKLSSFARNAGRPYPIQQGDGTDLLAFAKTKGATTQIDFFGKRLRRVARLTLTGNGTVVIGDFTSDPGEEIAVQGEGGVFSVANPFTSAITTVVADDEIPVDDVNINSFTSNQSNPGGRCTVADPTDGSNGFVWKPNSDTQYYAVAVMRPEYTGRLRKVEVLTSTGEYIKNLTYKGVGNGNRSNWQDYALTGADYYRRYGAISLKATLDDGSCLTYLIERPDRRYD